MRRRDFLKDMAALGLALAMPKEIYALTRNQELSWKDVKNILFYSHEGIAEYYKKKYEKMKYYYDPCDVYFPNSFKEYKKIKNELSKKDKSYIIGWFYVPSDDPRYTGDKVIEKVWWSYVREHHVPYGKEVDLDKSRIHVFKYDEDGRYNNFDFLFNVLYEWKITPPITKSIREYYHIVKEDHASWAFLEYMSSEGFKNKSFPEINGLSIHIFDMPWYLVSLRICGKKIPDKIYPMALYVIEVYDPRKGADNEIYREGRIDVIYWIESINVDDYTISWEFPFLSLGYFYFLKEKEKIVFPHYKLYITNLYVSLESSDLSIMDIDLSYDPTFFVELERKVSKH